MLEVSRLVVRSIERTCPSLSEQLIEWNTDTTREDEEGGRNSLVISHFSTYIHSNTPSLMASPREQQLYLWAMEAWTDVHECLLPRAPPSVREAARAIMLGRDVFSHLEDSLSVSSPLVLLTISNHRSQLLHHLRCTMSRQCSLVRATSWRNYMIWIIFGPVATRTAVSCFSSCRSSGPS